MTWAINRRQFPGGKAMLRGEGDREAKRLLVNCGCRENNTIPNDQNAPRSSIGGREIKFIKSLRYKFLQDRHINVLYFCFLETDD